MTVRRTFRRLIAVTVSIAAVAVSVIAIGLVITARRPVAETQVVAAGLEQFTKLRHTETVADSPATSNPAERAHPMFNARSCAECHRQAGVGGGGPNENNVRLVNKIFTSLEPEWVNQFGPGQGIAVLHRHSLAPEYAAWRLALIRRFAPLDREIPDRIQLRLEKSVGTATESNFPRPTPLEERNTPPLFGLGLIDAIPQADIDRVAARQPREVRGRSPRLKGGGRGRFGWKANSATLAAFNENACAVELGLSTPRFTPAVFRPNSPLPTGEEPAATGAVDMTEADLAALTRFVAELPPPQQVHDPETSERAGYGLRHFHAIGCAECHRPVLGNVGGLYSDLLLHNIGTSGGVYYGFSPPRGGPDFDIVAADEFRTPPLWGVADSAPYMHDGTAPTLEQAILQHLGQALPSREAYFHKLTFQDRNDLLAFLESLRAPGQHGREDSPRPNSRRQVSEMPDSPPVAPAYIQSARIP